MMQGITQNTPPLANNISNQETPDSTLSFKNDLWDKFGVVIEKLEIGKANIKELQAFFKGQAEVQLAMGKKLSKTSLNEKKTDIGELVEPANVMSKNANMIGEKLISCANELTKVLCAELQAIRSEIVKKVKSSKSEEKKISKEFKTVTDNCVAARKKDSDEKRTYETLQITLYKKEDIPPKKLQKLQNAVHNAERSSKKAEADYKAAVQKQKEVREKYYEKLGQILDELEQLDKKRIEVVKSVLEKYLKLQTSLGETMSQGCDLMKQSFTAINADRDILEFVKKTRSGASKPPPKEFEPYVVKIPEELAVNRFSVAQRDSKVSTSSDTSSVKSSPVVLQNSKSVTQDPRPSTPIGGTDPKVIKQVRAVYKYDPKDAEELAINEGDIINVYEMNDDGWWLGEKNGKKGLFPSNFVEDYDGTKQESSNHSVPQDKPIGVAIALYPYDAGDENELSLQEGDRITVYHKGEDGWWLGELRGKRGLFPSNYTKEE